VRAWDRSRVDLTPKIRWPGPARHDADILPSISLHYDPNVAAITTATASCSSAAGD